MTTFGTFRGTILAIETNADFAIENPDLQLYTADNLNRF